MMGASNFFVVPARAELVIGPAEGRTRWLGRDDPTRENR